MSEPFAETGKYRSSASRLICLHGDQKTGKSSLLCTFPPEWKLHIIDFDGGLEPMLNLWDQMGKDRKNLTIKGAPTFKDLHAAMWNLPKGNDLYVLDTYTTAQKRFKAHVVLSMGLDPTSLAAVDPWKIGGKQSGYAAEYLERWKDQVAAEGAWGLIICQDKQKIEEPFPPKLCPDLPGAVGRDVAGGVNFLLHLEKERKTVGGKITWKRVLRTAETPNVMAGDRSHSLLPLEEADFSVLIEKIKKKRGE